MAHTASRRVSALLATLLLLGAVSCDSGLGNNLGGAATPPDPAPTSESPRTGLSLGDGLTQPVQDEVALAAGLLGATPAAFVAFTTTSDAAGIVPVDPGAPLDTNGQQDVFVAVLLPEAIEPAAFVRSFVPTLRHPRCVTCHSMNATVPPSTAFATAPAAHPGGMPPLNNTQGNVCGACHVNQTSFTGEWRAPPAEFDFRALDAATLHENFLTEFTPEELVEHLTMDPRINWALGSNDGELPPNPNFPNQVADDDHDGLNEPWDRDGVPRTVPGGKDAFLARMESWIDAGQPFDDEGAVLVDVALVSHRVGDEIAGNGASHSPSLVFVPVFPPVGDLVGYLEVAFVSSSEDLVAGDTNGVDDVFMARIDVLATDPLVPGDPPVVRLEPVLSDPRRASLSDGEDQADGASAAPSLGGALGEILVFESLAGNLVAGFGDNNGAAPDVFLRQLDLGQTRVLSHGVAPADGGAGGGSFAPHVSADGLGVAFESDATDLVPGDGNGVRDVFYALVEPSLSLDLLRASVADGGVEGSGGASRHASVAVLDAGAGRVRVAFESDKTDLIVPAHGSTNVYLFDSGLGTTTLLNQRLDADVAALGTIAQVGGGTLPADSFAPRLSPAGDFVLMDSLADNIDVLRPADESSGLDALLVDLSRLESDGFVLPFRVSVDELGLHGNADASAAALASFPAGSGVFPSGVVAFLTDATNLGAVDGGRHVINFVTDSPVAKVSFEADPLSGPAPLEVTFTDTTLGAVSAWDWDFGDGDGSNDQSPVHTYDDPGLYTVTLTVTGPTGTAELVVADLIEVLDAAPLTHDGGAPEGVAVPLRPNGRSVQAPPGSLGSGAPGPH